MTAEVRELQVEPGLLQDVPTASRRIDRKVEGEPVESLPCEAENGIGNGEAGVMDVVLVIGRVQSLVIVVVHVGAGLDKQVRLENKVALLRGNRKPFFSGEGNDAVFRIFFVLRAGSDWQEQKGRQQNHKLFHFSNI